jgi:hypothetical protein
MTSHKTATPADAPEPCPECGQVHPDEGDASTWPAWVDNWGAMPPRPETSRHRTRQRRKGDR